MRVWRQSRAAVFGVIAAALSPGLPGCADAVSQTATVTPCVVSTPDGAERVILTSEAVAGGDDASCECVFTLKAPGTERVDLELTAVGCSCYQVVHQGRRLRIGDHLAIAAGVSDELRIVAQTATTPGTREYRAEFSGRGRDGSAFLVPLVSTVRTVSNLVVQPDVVHVVVRDESGELKPIELKIEQTVRTDDPESLNVDWGELPGGVDGTPPIMVGEPTEIASGVWRATWRSAVGATADLDAEPAEPLRLPLVSRQADRVLARVDCMVIVRQRSGIRAPRLVHFGRVPQEARPTRRIQLQALDGRAFSVESVQSRNGEVQATTIAATAAPEHWLEMQIASTSDEVDDVLTVRTSHPVTKELRIAVRASRPRSPRASEVLDTAASAGR